jgi:hypothetical protein
MKALAILAPESGASGTGTTFDEIIRNRLGQDYIISEEDKGQVAPGCVLVIVDNKSKRVEAELL